VVPPAPTQFRQNVGVEEKHQRLVSRRGPFNRSNLPL
jgi:hypothetical protein